MRPVREECSSRGVGQIGCGPGGLGAGQARCKTARQGVCACESLKACPDAGDKSCGVGRSPGVGFEQACRLPNHVDQAEGGAGLEPDGVREGCVGVAGAGGDLAELRRCKIAELPARGIDQPVEAIAQPVLGDGEHLPCAAVGEEDGPEDQQKRHVPGM